MRGVRLWILAGIGLGFYGGWAAAGAAAALGCALVRRGWRAVCLASGLAGLCSGALGAKLGHAPVAGGTVMEVVDHVQEKGRRLHRLKGGGKRARRELDGLWAKGSPVWVPEDPRLPALALSGAVAAASRPEKKPEESLVDALTLGRDAPEKLRTQLRQAGLSHVLALSGLHLAIVTWMVLLVVGWLHRFLPQAWGVERRWLETSTGIAFAWSYHAATGGHVSTTRAALMLTMWLLSSRYWGAGGLLSGLAAAAAAMWAWEPGVVRDPAFQLSFAAVAGIGLAQKAAPGARGFWQSALVSAGATAATMPVVGWHFGRISPMFLINNIIFLPFFSFIGIPIAFIIQTIVLIWPNGGTPLRIFADTLALPGARWMGAWNALWPEWTAAGSAAWTLLLGAAIVWGARRRGRARMLPALGALLALCVLPWGRVDTSNLRLTFFAAGGESTLIRFPNGENWLVDAGTPGLGAQLARRGVARLHGVVLSHNHEDHVKEIFRLAETMDVDNVWVGPRFPEPWKRHLEAAGARVRPVFRMLPVAGGRMHLRSLLDAKGARVPEFWSENDASLVVELAWRGRSLWFLGDIEQEAEREIMRNCMPRRVDLIKVPHHGRATSTGPGLCACLKPDMAVICGGPADVGVVRRLFENGARVVQVDRVKEIAIKPLNKCGKE